MAKKKTVYSVWYRNIVLDIRKKQAEKERLKARQEEAERLRLMKDNAEKEKLREQLSKDRYSTREQRARLAVQNNGGMQRDFRDGLIGSRNFEKENREDFDKALYIVESRRDRRRREWEEKRIAKIKAKQLKLEEKEKDKALSQKVKMEKLARKEDDEAVGADSKKKIALERKMIKAQRAREKEERKAMKRREANKNRELTYQLKKEAALKREADKLLEKEFKKQERIRREKEEQERKIAQRRKKAAGATPMHNFSEKLRIFFRIYSYDNLRNTINTYGYSYSFFEFLKQTGLVVGGVSIIAYLSQLRGMYLFLVIAISFLVVPWLLYSWFNQLFNGKRFEMVQSYLSNLLPIFMQKPKIRYALQEVIDMSTGQMKSAIEHAIDYIDTTDTDEEVMKTGLSFIEAEFPNSRIKSVHKLLLDIEAGNSKDYSAICENMYTDVEGWIRRVYGFQKELKSRRSSLVILCIFTLGLNFVFTYMYGASEIFDGFTEKKAYQISTMMFILCDLLIIALILTQLHGAWLVYDLDNKAEVEDIKAYTYIHMYTPKIRKNDIMMGMIFAAAGVFMLVGMKQKTGIIVIGLAYFLLTKQKTSWNGKHKRISKSLLLEFPVWLRGVALNLHEMTVVNAIEESTKSCSYIMKKEIEKFFEIYNDNPTSIRAFNEFLSEYGIEDVQATMKVLFTMQSMSAEEIKTQVAALIIRNQELLTKTEEIKNKDSLGFAEMLGYAPMALLTVQLLISMILMFLHIMEYMDTIMSGGGM